MNGKFKIKTIDMTTGNILKNLLVFGLPIFIGSLFQQFYNIVDSIIVGRFVGADALAAVGSAGNIANGMIWIATGLTTGASVVVAQLCGAKMEQRIKHAISTTLIFAVFVAIAVTIIGLVIASPVMRLLRVPDTLMDDAVTYMKVFIAGTIFTMIYNFFSATLRSLGDSTTPLIFLVIASLLNVGGDILCVSTLKMGVAGAALATVGAQAISVILCAIYCAKKVPYFKFRKGDFIFDRILFKDILRYSIPTAIQGFVAQIGFAFVQGLINGFGSVYMAAYTAASKLEGLAHLPLDCFGTSLQVFVGQNMGAGNIKRVKQGLIRTIIVGCSICILVAGLIIVFGSGLISMFIDGSETQIIDIGSRFLKIWAPWTAAFMLMNAFGGVLRGAGDSIVSMIASFCDLIGRTASAYFFVDGLGLDFYWIARAIYVGWLISLLCTGIRYFTGKWKNKTISAVKELVEDV